MRALRTSVIIFCFSRAGAVAISETLTGFYALPLSKHKDKKERVKEWEFVVKEEEMLLADE